MSSMHDRFGRCILLGKIEEVVALNHQEKGRHKSSTKSQKNKTSSKKN